MVPVIAAGFVGIRIRTADPLEIGSDLNVFLAGVHQPEGISGALDPETQIASRVSFSNISAVRQPAWKSKKSDFRWLPSQSLGTR